MIKYLLLLTILTSCATTKVVPAFCQWADKIEFTKREYDIIVFGFSEETKRKILKYNEELEKQCSK